MIKQYIGVAPSTFQVVWRVCIGKVGHTIRSSEEIQGKNNINPTLHWFCWLAVSVFLTSSDDRSIKITHTCSDVWTSVICSAKNCRHSGKQPNWWTMCILKKKPNMMKHVDIQNPAKITRNMWILNNTCQQIMMLHVDIEQHLPENDYDKCGYWTKPAKPKDMRTCCLTNHATNLAYQKISQMPSTTIHWSFHRRASSSESMADSRRFSVQDG